MTANTLKISIPEVVSVEKEFNIPCFFKTGTSSFIAIYNDYSVRLFKGENMPSIHTISQSDAIKTLQDGSFGVFYTEIDGLDFALAFNAAVDMFTEIANKVCRNNGYHQIAADEQVSD